MRNVTEWERLRLASDYREFLRAYLDERSIKLADLARAAGFGRGFPGDVISGKRRLTAKSCFAFEKAMRIPAQGKKLFKLLVASEEPDVFPELVQEKIPMMIQELRTRPWTRGRREVAEQSLRKEKVVLRDPRAGLIFAACGSPGLGATRAELQARTQLSDTALDEIIDQLRAVGLLNLNEKANRYEPQDLHMFLKSHDRSELLINLFRSACEAASVRVVRAADSECEMFFTSMLCVDEEKLPELKAALRETILKFVDDSIQPEGNRVMRLITAFHK